MLKTLWDDIRPNLVWALLLWLVGGSAMTGIMAGIQAKANAPITGKTALLIFGVSAVLLMVLFILQMWFLKRPQKEGKRLPVVPVKFVPIEQTTIYGHTFRNQQLDVDNKIFDHCTFENVSFMYHGIGPTKFIEARMKNNAANTMLLTDHEGIVAFMTIASDFKTIIGREPKTGLMDDKGNTMPFRSPEVKREPSK